jgi:hypothetical protein
MAATTTIDNVLSTFPYPSLSPITGVPTFETINDMVMHLKANAAAIQTDNGGGQLGFLGVMVSPVVYATLSDTPFVVPPNPGPNPPPLDNATAAQITENVRVHTENLRMYRQYITVSQALKRQIIETVDDIYIRTLRNRHTGYASLSPYQLVTHLYLTYGAITPMDMDANDEKFKRAYDPAQPFEMLVQQIEDAQEYADAGGNAYSSTQIVTNAYSLIFRTGMFPEACREWRRKPVASQTWQAFKEDFTIAYNDFSTLRSTTQSAGFHHANNAMEAFATETAEAFANLATAAAADRNMLSSLQTTNQTLLQQMTVRDAEITQLRTMVQQLQAGQSNRSNSNRGTNPRATTGVTGGNVATPGKKRYPNLNYCWTHGFDIDPRHDSTNCRNTATGHQATATRANPMGGSIAGQGKTIQ